jgi:hypothetical protein
MRKTLFTLFILFFGFTAWAQTGKPVMTPAFSDSLKKQISAIIPADYSIKLSYQSTLSADGKLLKPLITHQISEGTVNDNDFIQKLRALIKNAPAWVPSGAEMVSFDIEIKNGQVSVTDKTK